LISTSLVLQSTPWCLAFDFSTLALASSVQVWAGTSGFSRHTRASASWRSQNEPQQGLDSR
jgi:hypothetical protein